MFPAHIISKLRALRALSAAHLCYDGLRAASRKATRAARTAGQLLDVPEIAE